MMERLNTLAEVQESLRRHDFVLLYISRPDCGVCLSLLPKIRELEEEFPKMKVVHVDHAEIPELSSAFTILSAPAILLFIDEKEMLRRAGIISVDLLKEDLQKLYTAYFQ